MEREKPDSGHNAEFALLNATLRQPLKTLPRIMAFGTVLAGREIAAAGSCAVLAHQPTSGVAHARPPASPFDLTAFLVTVARSVHFEQPHTLPFRARPRSLRRARPLSPPLRAPPATAPQGKASSPAQLPPGQPPQARQGRGPRLPPLPGLATQGAPHRAVLPEPSPFPHPLPRLGRSLGSPAPFNSEGW